MRNDKPAKVEVWQVCDSKDECPRVSAHVATRRPFHGGNATPNTAEKLRQIILKVTAYPTLGAIRPCPLIPEQNSAGQGAGGPPCAAESPTTPPPELTVVPVRFPTGGKGGSVPGLLCLRSA